jgi:hypothetical protein
MLFDRRYSRDGSAGFSSYCPTGEQLYPKTLLPPALVGRRAAWKGSLRISADVNEQRHREIDGDAGPKLPLRRQGDRSDYLAHWRHVSDEHIEEH